MPSEQRCSLGEYLHGEEEVSVCVDKDGEDWDANFLAKLNNDDKLNEADDEDDMDVDEEPVSKFTRFSQVIKKLDDIKLFLEDRGCTNEANAVSSAVDIVASVHIASMKQITLRDFFMLQTKIGKLNFTVWQKIYQRDHYNNHFTLHHGLYLHIKHNKSEKQVNL